MKSAELQKHLANLWTVDDVAAYFDVTPMTVYLWRVHRGLPAVVISGNARNAVRFVPNDVIAWAKANNQAIARVSLAVA